MDLISLDDFYWRIFWNYTVNLVKFKFVEINSTGVLLNCSFKVSMKMNFNKARHNTLPHLCIRSQLDGFEWTSVVARALAKSVGTADFIFDLKLTTKVLHLYTSKIAILLEIVSTLINTNWKIILK